MSLITIPINITLNADVDAIVARVTSTLKENFMTKDELQAALDDLNARFTGVGDQLDKASAEITAQVQKLKDEIANGNVGTTPAMDETIRQMQATADRLKGQSQALDDENPDAPAEPPPVENP